MVTLGQLFKRILIWFEWLEKAREYQDPFQACGLLGQLQWVPLSPSAAKVLVVLLSGPSERG